MIEIICGTNRPSSRSLAVCHILKKKFEKNQAVAEILDIADAGLSKMDSAPYSEERPKELVQAVNRVNQAKGLVMVIPEYNGSYPGILKYFIDHWSYPLSFESRPVCFVGLGGRFGGLRPVEHLQGVFGYRNSYIFPERVFISNIWSVLKEERIDDDVVDQLLNNQVSNFVKFINGLHTEGLDALSRLEASSS